MHDGAQTAAAAASAPTSALTTLGASALPSGGGGAAGSASPHGLAVPLTGSATSASSNGGAAAGGGGLPPSSMRTTLTPTEVANGSVNSNLVPFPRLQFSRAEEDPTPCSPDCLVHQRAIAGLITNSELRTHMKETMCKWMYASHLLSHADFERTPRSTQVVSSPSRSSTL